MQRFVVLAFIYILAAVTTVHASSLRDYTQIRHLGSGTYGEVKLYRLSSGSNDAPEVAIKKVPIMRDGIFSYDCIREVVMGKILAGLPNIAQTNSFFIEGNNLYLVMEYCPHTLQNTIETAARSKISFAAFIKIAQGILRGLASMHDRNFCHLDLKPANILLSAKEGVKIIDFGIAQDMSINAARKGITPQAKFFSDFTLSPNVFTRWYRPPDLLLGVREYDRAGDYWSVGISLYQLVRGLEKPLSLMADTEIGTLFSIFQLVGTPVEDTLHHGLTDRQRFPLFQSNIFPRFVPNLAAKLAAANGALVGTDEELAKAHALISDLLTPDPDQRLEKIRQLEHNHPWLFEDSNQSAAPAAATGSTAQAANAGGGAAGQAMPNADPYAHLNLESKNLPQFENSHQNTHYHRILAAWLLDVHEKFRHSFVSYYSSIALIEAALARLRPERDKIQLIAIASTAVMTRYYSDEGIYNKDCRSITANSYSIAEVEGMIKTLLTIAGTLPHLWDNSIHRSYLELIHSPDLDPDSEEALFAHTILLILSQGFSPPFPHRELFAAVRSIATSISRGQSLLAAQAEQNPAREFVLAELAAYFDYADKEKRRGDSIDAFLKRKQLLSLYEKIKTAVLPPAEEA
jgi:serine/threonine protein kinase